MMNIINLKEKEIGYTDQFFFDTNIWLLLFGTIANYEEQDQKAYSGFFEKLLDKEKPIFITSMILSEYANVILRLGFNQWKQNQKDLISPDFKKNYVGTDDYKESVESISISLNKILGLPNIMPVGGSLNAVNKNNILSNFLLTDFNDSYIAELARLNNYQVVSNDRDFQKLSSNITLITNKL